MKKYILIAICFVITQSLFAQIKNVEFDKDNFPGKKEELKEAKANIKRGDDLLSQSDYLAKDALPFFQKANEFNPSNDEVNYKIGYCMLKSVDKVHAWEFLEKASKINPKVSKDLFYQLGYGYQEDDQFDKAIAAFEKYKSDNGSKLSDDELAATNKHIQECKNGIELVKKPIRVFLDDLDDHVNSRFPEYGPVISADEEMLLFTSRRDGNPGDCSSYGIPMPCEDIFMSRKESNGEWGAAVSLGPPINSESHDAIIGLSPDGQTMLIYRDEKGDGNIFLSTLEGNVWTKPEKMPSPINTKSHEPSATMSYDGNTFYFVSNRDGGLGGHDIYMCTKDIKGKWGKAINLGPAVNTIYDEDGVFMMPDGKTLYFSSKGHNTMGGYDIFKTVNVNGIWSTPENMGYPVNDSDDDVFFVLSANGRRGYYAAFHKGGHGEKDLYRITFLGPEKQPVLNTEDNLLASLTAPVKEVKLQEAATIKGPQITLLKGVITDAFTNRPLEATIDLIDNIKNELLATFKSNSSTGKYLVSLPSGRNYGIAVKKEGYLFHSENFDLPATADYQEVTKDIALKNIAVGSTIVLKNIFFDLSKATLRPESTNELERLAKLLTDVPTLRIEISGHTDSRGSADLNQKLSESRAKAVVDYLTTNKGIAASRLEFKGYGFAKPLVANAVTEDDHQMNRRTEFKIIGK